MKVRVNFDDIFYVMTSNDNYLLNDENEFECYQCSECQEPIYKDDYEVFEAELLNDGTIEGGIITKVFCPICGEDIL